MDKYSYETLKITKPRKLVLHVQLNRPKKLNAMNTKFWSEFRDCFQKIALDSDVRAVIVSGAGRMFTSGLDISAPVGSANFGSEDVGRKAEYFRRLITDLQETFTVMEKCTKPVIAAIHNGCIGGGIDLITACDIRLCSQDAWFSVKEVDLGLAADVGTLQRLPKVIGNQSKVRELVFTGRSFSSDEALDIGLVSNVYLDKDSLLKNALNLASVIASKSPIAVQGSKVNLLYSRDHSVENSLKFMTVWNASMLQSEDTIKAVMAKIQKEKAEFSKL